MIVTNEGGYRIVLMTDEKDSTVTRVKVFPGGTCGKCRRIHCFMVNRGGKTLCVDCDGAGEIDCPDCGGKGHLRWTEYVKEVKIDILRRRKIAEFKALVGYQEKQAQGVLF